MKRFITTALLLLLVLPSFAWTKKHERLPSPYRHEVNVTWGMFPGDEIYGHDTFFSSYEGGLDNIYGNYMDKCLTSGVISVDYNIQYKRWFALGTQINGSVTRHIEMSAITGSEVTRNNSFAISALAYARFTYVNREFIKVYSAIGLGIRYSKYGKQKEIHYDYQEKGFIIARQVIPIGVTIGRKVYGIFEYNIGSDIFGGRFGIGYRF